MQFETNFLSQMQRKVAKKLDIFDLDILDIFDIKRLH